MITILICTAALVIFWFFWGLASVGRDIDRDDQ